MFNNYQAYEGEYNPDDCQIYNRASKETLKSVMVGFNCRLKDGWRLRQITEEDAKKGTFYLGSSKGTKGASSGLCKCGNTEANLGLYRLIVEEGEWIEPEEPEDPWQFEGYRPFFTSELQEILTEHNVKTGGNDSIFYGVFGDGSAGLYHGLGGRFDAFITFGTKSMENETERLAKIKKFLEERRRDMKK